MSQRIFQACSSYVGRSYQEYNCWDLIKSLYEDIYDLDIHEYYGDNVPKRQEVEKLIRTNAGEFVKVGLPEPGDILTIKVFGIESHMSLYLGNNKMIHSREKTGVVIESASRYEKLITGIWRHRGFVK